MHPYRGQYPSVGAYTPSLDQQTEREQLLRNLDQLSTTVGRVYAILHDFEELTKHAKSNLQNSYALHEEINSTAERLGLSPLRAWRIEFLSKRSNEK